MIEKPPRFGSKRFRNVLWTALRGDPLAALKGLVWFATRKRVRGWSRMMIAASEAPYDYERWILSGEPRAIARFRQSHAQVTDRPVIPVIIDDERSEIGAKKASVASLRAAFGSETSIFAISSNGENCRLVPERARESLGTLAAFIAGDLRSGWLLPVLAGDIVSGHLPDVLNRVLPKLDEASLVYWDEDRIVSEGRQDPWVKPDWDMVLFNALAGLAGSSALSLASARSMEEPFRDRSTAERCLLSAATSAGPEPFHVSLILTHRAESNALGSELPGTTRKPSSRATWPSISIIVPTRDRADLLASCLRGLHQTSYPGEVELIIVDNGTEQPEALSLIEGLKADRKVRVIHDRSPFNFAKLNNRAANEAEGEYLCLLNNDVEATDPRWLQTLVDHASDDAIGAVGPMLLYPSGRIQHAGVAIGVGGAAGHVQKGVFPSDRRFWTWHAATREVSAVTAAVLVIKKDKFLRIGGFDDAFAVAFNDVDLCLRLKAAGLKNLYVSDVRLIHRESESRGDDRTRKNAKRYAGELAELQSRWGTQTFEDPHFSPLFSRLVERCVLAP